MSGTQSYNSDRVSSGEVEYPVSDPASGAFFQSDYKKNEDLKTMLDSSKDNLKLEAMKRIIGMIAKGRDASDLFPAVVKNVVSKNIEVKKLVYVYLVRYAEEQQDLALLSISTFQRALKDPNQLIRASALRVLSSIRVPMIVPIVMLAIRDSASDMSPYVRKTAAHAIPKLYSLDAEQKEELVSVIDKLLSDKAHLVVGSAAMAFLEVCPERMSLIHRSFRKLCSLLADVDEWGQLALLNVLTVYARNCFPDPNSEEYSSSDTEKPFYDDTDSDTSAPERRKKRPSQSPSLDADHRLLLRAAKPLLQSRNSGVVMAVAQLYYHCGPAQELPPVAKAMVRLLRAPLEVQSVVLNSVAALTVSKRSLYEPFLKSFFVRNSDPTHIKLLKLEILTNLATEASAPTVLREFQTYVTSSDKAFVAATIQAIGRLAVSIETETETCLNGLLKLLSSKDEWVVCEAVVVVKRVVGGGAASARAALARASKLLRSDRLGGGARAAALWLIAEHGVKHPRAPAILAHMLKSFCDQDELVKLQLLSLAVKLALTQPETVPMCRYAVSLARYDTSYDVRDRARLLRRFIDPQPNKQLPRFAEAIFRPEKPKPTIESSFKDRSQFTVGTLSQYIGWAAAGYRPLPVPPAAVTDAAQRDADHNTTQDRPNEPPKDKNFYSEPESSGSDSSSSDSESSSSSEETTEEADSATEDTKPEKKKAKVEDPESSSSASEESEPDSSSDEESDSGDSSVESSEEESRSSDRKKIINKVKQEEKKAKSDEIAPQERKSEKSNLELLLELDELASALPTMTPTCGGLLSPPFSTPTTVHQDESITPVGPSLVPSTVSELVSRVVWNGVSAQMRWTRAPHLYSHKMCAIEIIFTNHSKEDVNNIRLNKKTLTGSRTMHDFAPISSLAPGACASTTLGIDFADTIQPIEFTITASIGEVSTSIAPPVGELMRAVTMSENRWDIEHKKLRGMTESMKKSSKFEDEKIICKSVFEVANVAAVTSTGEFLRFAGRMMSSQELVLLSVRILADCTQVTANCSNMAIASLLADKVDKSLAKSHMEIS